MLVQVTAVMVSRHGLGRRPRMLSCWINMVFYCSSRLVNSWAGTIRRGVRGVHDGGGATVRLGKAIWQKVKNKHLAFILDSRIFWQVGVEESKALYVKIGMTEIDMRLGRGWIWVVNRIGIGTQIILSKSLMYFLAECIMDMHLAESGPVSDDELSCERYGFICIYKCFFLHVFCFFV